MKNLKNVLLLNAVSSGATGMGLIIFAGFMADIFGLSQLSPFYSTGVFLVVFAGFVLYEGFQKPIRASHVLFISVLDSIWVLTSLVIVLLGLFNLSFIGYSLITGVAIWVAAMAYLQMKGIKYMAA